MCALSATSARRDASGRHAASPAVTASDKPAGTRARHFPSMPTDKSTATTWLALPTNAGR
jgi:hypothetical protein